MSKPKFYHLIEELQTDLIIFIDDDFTPINNVGQILFHITTLNEVDYELICPKLTDVDDGICQLITQFRENFAAHDFLSEDMVWFEAGEIIQHLKSIEQNELSALAQEIWNRMARSQDNFATLAMMYGLAPVDGAVTCYKPFIDAINIFSKRKSVRIYRSLEGDNFNAFEEEIKNVLAHLENKYFLLIADKILANNQNGKDIISGLQNRENGINAFFSVLFTSRLDVQANNPINFQNYFHFEIQKPEQDGDNAIEKVSQGLALCAYAAFFQALFELRESALKEANSLVIVSGKENMLYLADMAHAEGATVFRTIDNWFELLVQKKISDRLRQKKGDLLDFNFIVGLTSLINSQYLPDSVDEIVPQFKTELQQLSSYELFEYAINYLHFPPSPGDIYKIGDELFILTGQDCDLIVRDDGTSVSRKEKLAELVKCKFNEVPLDDKKKEDEKSLSLNHFQYEERYGALQIEFNKRSNFDFKILDLCSTNENGFATFQSASGLSKAATKALPQMWSKYYPELISEITEKIKVYTFLATENINRETVASDNSFLLDFTQDGDIISFPVKRIGRLKGQFKEYFLNRYWEYKTRKGLNTISVYNRKAIVVDSVKYGFFEEKIETQEKLNAWLQLTADRERNRKIDKLSLIVSKHSLLPIIEEPHKATFNATIGEEIVLENDLTHGDLIFFKKTLANNKLSLEIGLPFFNSITQKYFKGKKKMFFADMFTDGYEQPALDAIYTIIGVDGDHNLFENGGRTPTITLDQLQTGINIPSLNLSIQLNRATGILSQIEQA